MTPIAVYVTHGQDLEGTAQGGRGCGGRFLELYRFNGMIIRLHITDQRQCNPATAVPEPVPERQGTSCSPIIM